MLDAVKKNIFYGKPVDKQKFHEQWQVLVQANHRLDTVESWTITRHPGRDELNIDPRVFHAIVGAITESAELAEALKKGITDSSIDFVNILEEFGDINWYEAIAVDALKGNFQEILERNVAKLKARFPNKFTNENAINRDLDKERAILEGK